MPCFGLFTWILEATLDHSTKATSCYILNKYKNEVSFRERSLVLNSSTTDTHLRLIREILHSSPSIFFVSLLGSRKDGGMSDTQRYRQRDRETDRETERETERQRDRLTERDGER